jgi:hypothetical protein
MASRDGYPDGIVLVEPFMHSHEVENTLLEVVKHANLHCMEKVGLRKVAHNEGNMLIPIESWVTIERRVFGIGWVGVSIAEHSI